MNRHYASVTYKHYLKTGFFLEYLSLAAKKRVNRKVTNSRT